MSADLHLLTSLVTLTANDAGLTGTLDIHGLAALTSCNCDGNPLTGLNVSGVACNVSAQNLTAAALFTLSGSLAPNINFTGSQFTSFSAPSLASTSGNITFSSCGAVTSISLPALVHIGNDLLIDDTTSLSSCDLSSLIDVNRILFLNSGIVSISLPAATTFFSDLIANNCPSLISVSAPIVQHITDFCNFGSCPSLGSLSFPDVVDNLDSGIILDGDTSLTSLSFASVTHAISGISAPGCTSLTSLLFNNCIVVNQPIDFSGCTSLSQITNAEFPSGLSASTDQNYSGCTNLTTFSVTNWSMANGTTVSWLGDALTAASIAHILSRAVALGINSGTIDVSGGTNAAYSTWGAGAQSDEATLTTAGVTVNYTP